MRYCVMKRVQNIVSEAPPASCSKTMLPCGWVVLILPLVPGVLSCPPDDETDRCCPLDDECCNDGAPDYCCADLQGASSGEGILGQGCLCKKENNLQDRGFYYQIHHTVNRLRSFLSLGHLVAWYLGCLVAQSSLGHLVT